MFPHAVIAIEVKNDKLSTCFANLCLPGAYRFRKNTATQEVERKWKYWHHLHFSAYCWNKHNNTPTAKWKGASKKIIGWVPTRCTYYKCELFKISIIVSIKITNSYNEYFPLQEIVVREVGGAMAPLWNQYYKNVTKIIYVVDASNLCQIAAAGVLLYTVLAEPQLKNAKVSKYFQSHVHIVF